MAEPKQVGADPTTATPATPTGNHVIPLSSSLDQKKADEHNTNDRKSKRNTDKEMQAPHTTTIRPTRKRYFILFMYIVLQSIKSFQWICLASVTNVAAQFYRVDNFAINWTTILFMVTYLVMALPVSWLMELFGLRRSVLIGSIGITLGLLIKCFSCHRDGFAIGMLGHLIVGLSEPFFFSSYSQVASIWFPDEQVARATSFALIGQESGLAVGFIIPPLLIDCGGAGGSKLEDYDEQCMQSVQDGLLQMFLPLAIISTLNTISMFIFFDEQPLQAPGVARYKQIEAIKTLKNICTQSRTSITLKNYRIQLRQLNQVVRDKSFISLLIGFGLNVGSAYSIHTLLNQMIMRSSWPPFDAAIEYPISSGSISRSLINETLVETLGAQNSSSGGSGGGSGVNGLIINERGDPNLVVGNTGLILIVAGLFGSAFGGYILDSVHKYKLTISMMYLFSLLSMALMFLYLTLFGSSDSPTVWPLYLFAIPLGFALTGYASCAFDYGVEITYPRAELLSATLLNISAQLFGIPISLFGSQIVDSHGNQALGLFFCTLLLIGFILSCVQSGQLHRQDAINYDDNNKGGAAIGELENGSKKKEITC